MKPIKEYILHELEHDTAPQPVVSIIADLNYDYIYTSSPLEAGTEVLISDFTRNIAGAGGYVACGLGKLGARVYLLTHLGDDKEGKMLYEDIVRHGVERDGIQLLSGKKSPFTLIFTGEKEDSPRQVATFPGTSTDLSIHSIDFEDYVQKSVLVYSCNYFILKRLREEIDYVFRFAEKNCVLTAYDANAGDGWENEKALDTLRNKIHPHSDIVFLNENEACHLSKTDNPDAAIARISPKSTTVVIKLGEKGVLLRHRDRRYRLDAFPVGKVRDTVGAGDSFQAAFMYFYLKKFPIELSALLGAANAASTVLYRGGTEGQLDARGLAGFIDSYKIYDAGDGYIHVER
jgi:sugar/nucleoside kinase (ribokinase family)